MKKTIIIKKNYEFKNFFKKGKFFSGNYLEIFIHKNNKDHNKLGVVTSKKIGKRVERNRVKRLIKENYTILEKEMNIGFNIVISFKKNVESKDVNFYIIKDELIDLFKRAGLL